MKIPKTTVKVDVKPASLKDIMTISKYGKYGYKVEITNLTLYCGEKFIREICEVAGIDDLEITDIKKRKDEE